jgi:hypothetical protein
MIERKPIVGQAFVPAAELPLGAVQGQMKAYSSDVARLLRRHAGQKAGCRAEALPHKLAALRTRACRVETRLDSSRRRRGARMERVSGGS